MTSVIHGDCLEVLATLPADSIDACVTDPPYHLISTVERFGAQNAAPAQFGTDGAYARMSKGFMGKQWDGGDVAFRPETWAAVLRVMKPGAHMLCFGGTRTSHRMVCAIEDAGFEIRDTMMWIYGSGFPKSHNAGGGWGTALKPAYEPIILCRKPLDGTVAANVLRHGTGGLNIDACRVPSGSDHAAKCASVIGLGSNRNGACYGEWTGERADSYSPKGRWPANCLHDGSPEVEAAFAAFGSNDKPNGRPNCSGKTYGTFKNVYHTDDNPKIYAGGHFDIGTASRFFYCAKATAADRAGSKHPTIKPIALIRYLCRLITPPNGMILDPFAGSGTTGEAAMLEGFSATLIEQDPASIADIRHRVARWAGADAPLFAEAAQ